MKVKIIGIGGSIGSHLAHACRRMGWDVDGVDNSAAALLRMQNEIYPGRYGKWDPAIKLFHSSREPKGGYDIIMIGTPPDVRMKLAIEAAKEAPRLIHLEKPLYAPTIESVEEFERFKETLLQYAPDCIVTVGYDHAVSSGAQFVSVLLQKKFVGDIITFDVEFRETWKGIFAAHPWLSGPEDSYLGYWYRGGGAGCEHSHALHLWLYFAGVLGWEGLDAQCLLDIKTEGKVEYDQIAFFNMRTTSGKVGRVVQDVVTDPPKKVVRFQGTKGFIEWLINGSPDGDPISYSVDGKVEAVVVHKKRPDDFYMEMLHYDALLRGDIAPCDSPLALSLGAKVMEILCEAYSLASGTDDGESHCD